MPGARFVDPKVLARIGNLELLARTRRRRVHQRPAPRAVLRRVDRLRRASRLRRRRRHPPRRLAAVRANRSLLRQAVRGRHQHQLHDPVRHLAVDELLERRRHQARIRLVPRRLPRLPRAAAARPRRHHHLRRRHRHARAAVGEALQRRAAHARSRQGRAAGPSERAAQQDGRALQAPRHPAADLGFLRRARRDPRRDQAAAASSATT